MGFHYWFTLPVAASFLRSPEPKDIAWMDAAITDDHGGPLATTTPAASVGHFVNFARTGGDVLVTVLSIVIFTVPGVIAGAQVGSLVASRIPQRLLERSLAILLAAVALLTLREIIL